MPDMNIRRLTILITVLLILNSEADAKTFGELQLECLEAVKLDQTRSPIGVDLYQTATCYAYIEAHLDSLPSSICLPRETNITDLARIITGKPRSPSANENASKVLKSSFQLFFPCPE